MPNVFRATKYHSLFPVDEEIKCKGMSVSRNQDSLIHYKFTSYLLFTNNSSIFCSFISTAHTGTPTYITPCICVNTPQEFADSQKGVVLQLGGVRQEAKNFSLLKASLLQNVTWDLRLELSLCNNLSNGKWT
jgi:hypothetical protein